MRDRSKPSAFSGRARRYGLMEPRTSSEVVVRRLELGELAPAVVRLCVRCGGSVETDAPGPFVFHDECRPAPAPVAAVIADADPRVRLAMTSHRDNEPRMTHLSGRDRRRVLAWLAENGPATGRMIGWALNLPAREVSLMLREIDGVRVETAGVLATKQRGRPPVLWQLKAAIAA